MKKLIALALSLLALGGCGAAGAVWPAAALAAEAAGDAALTALEPGSAEYDACVGELYGLGGYDVLDGAILAAGGASAEEVAVFRFASAGEAARAAGELEDYLLRREADFTGYMPDEASLAAAGEVRAEGAYCAMAILPDAAEAMERFAEALGGEPPEDSSAAPAPGAAAPEESAGPGWEYDEARIVEAYNSGDSSGLCAEELAILERVEYVLAELAPDTLSDYERELAIHDYIIGCASYDSNTLSRLPFFTEDPNNRNPYGALVSGRAVCEGYSSTFRLFMELTGIECITVTGEANAGREPHAWNMVKLDGEWYCVDVTWDDPTTLCPVSESVKHRYFNVTSDFLRANSHFWDENGVPEAEATRWAWQG